MQLCEFLGIHQILDMIPGLNVILHLPDYIMVVAEFRDKFG